MHLPRFTERSARKPAARHGCNATIFPVADPGWHRNARVLDNPTGQFSGTKGSPRRTTRVRTGKPGLRGHRGTKSPTLARAAGLRADTLIWRTAAAVGQKIAAAGHVPATSPQEAGGSAAQQHDKASITTSPAATDCHMPNAKGDLAPDGPSLELSTMSPRGWWKSGLYRRRSVPLGEFST